VLTGRNGFALAANTARKVAYQLTADKLFGRSPPALWPVLKEEANGRVSH
jgi:hypothetical protein